MSYESAAYDKQNDDGFPPDPVVVIVATGTHDVSRLIHLLNGGAPVIEQYQLGKQVNRQVNRHNAGRAAHAEAPGAKVVSRTVTIGAWTAGGGAGIRPVTYWEAWCVGDGSGAHQIDGADDFTAYREPDQWDAILDDDESGCILPDGRVFCSQHVPPEVCTAVGTTTYVHQPADDDPSECSECGAALPAVPAPAVTA